MMPILVIKILCYDAHLNVIVYEESSIRFFFVS